MSLEREEPPSSGENEHEPDETAESETGSESTGESAGTEQQAIQPSSGESGTSDDVPGQEPADQRPSSDAGNATTDIRAQSSTGLEAEAAQDIMAERVSEQRGRTDRLVFGVAGVLAIAFVLWGALNTDALTAVSGAALHWVITNLGWAFVASASGFVVFALWLAVSRYGRIPLGADNERPEFRTVSWIAMMFSAGMGIGLMFFGVAEPLTHFTDPPPGTGVEPESRAAMQTAMATTLFHWTLHPWAIYAVVGLAIAYGTFRKGRRQLISLVFAPLLGTRRAEGGFGRVIDIMAIFATLFGSAASLGIGALQIGEGLRVLEWMDTPGAGLLVGVIAVLTLAFIASAVSGIARGIQWLSNTNMVLAGLLAVFLFVVGPTMLVLNLIPTSIGQYVQDLPMMSARTEATGGPAVSEWLAGNSVFYWAWWMSWTPFVGMFIARISRGRSIREFVVGVLLVPSLVSLVWFAIFGGTALFEQAEPGVNLVGEGGEEAQLFGLLNLFPMFELTSVLVMALVAIFFVSGADAASIVMGTLSQRGSIEPRRWVVIFWGALTGAVAAIMLLVGGGQSEALDGLETITVTVGAPFMLVMVALCFAVAKDLRNDPLMRRAERGRAVVEEAVVVGTEQYGPDFQLAVTDTNTPPSERISDRRPRVATRGRGRRRRT